MLFSLLAVKCPLNSRSALENQPNRFFAYFTQRALPEFRAVGSISTCAFAGVFPIEIRVPATALAAMPCRVGIPAPRFSMLLRGGREHRKANLSRETTLSVASVRAISFSARHRGRAARLERDSDRRETENVDAFSPHRVCKRESRSAETIDLASRTCFTTRPRGTRFE